MLPALMFSMGFAGAVKSLSGMRAVFPLLICMVVVVSSSRNCGMVTCVVPISTVSGSFLLVSIDVLTVDAAILI